MEPDEPFAALQTELEELRQPVLSVNVDFNDLLGSHSVEEALDILGKLKDLLA